MTDDAGREIDVAIVGAGAAGLMTAIRAARASRGAAARPSIVVFDGARTLGAKILVAGGGRCNVTHHRVDENDYCGSTRPAIRKVLLRFGVEETVKFFRELGVELKREETGKLFPTTDSARTVLEALLRAALDAGVELRHPWRVLRVERDGEGFALLGGAGSSATEGPAPGGELRVRARRLVLATGGRSLPRTGSDGGGYELARSLGHSITARVFPALAPIVLEAGSPLRALAGISADATLEVRAGSGRRLASASGSVLCTHFGLSGPAALDISRRLAHARADDPEVRLVVGWLAGETNESIERAVMELGGGPVGRLARGRLPERLLAALLASAGVDPATPAARMTREQRRAVARALTEHDVRAVGDRGYTYAEATAGGVPLRELRLETMASRVCPGLHVVGELCDVDGRIGGFNFQWAWATGHVAGEAIASAVRAAEGST